MNMFRPGDWWDRFFAIGIVVKGLDGLLELIGGILLLLVDPARIHHLVIRLTQPELSEDPRDFIATHLLHASGSLTVFDVLVVFLTWREYGKQRARVHPPAGRNSR
jgi:uncharacterized membrane protein